MKNLPYLTPSGHPTDDEYYNPVEVEKRHKALFEKYPLKPMPAIESSVTAEQIEAELKASDDNTRIIREMIFAYTQPNLRPQQVINFSIPAIKQKCFEIGWEPDFELMGAKAIRAYKLKYPKWKIIVVMKRYNAKRDTHFGEKGLGARDIRQMLWKRQQARQPNFTKIG